MSSSYYNSEDWGWYIDIENMNPVCQNKSNFPHKNLYRPLNKLETIQECEEDEYQYYLDNQKNLDDILIVNNINNNKFVYIHLLHFSSTTAIIVFIAYFVLYIL